MYDTTNGIRGKKIKKIIHCWQKTIFQLNYYDNLIKIYLFN